MKKLFWIAIAIAILAAFFPSTHPDGLDFISEKFNFAEKGQAGTALMADYRIPFIAAGGISTAVAGVTGVLMVLGIFGLWACWFKKGYRHPLKIW